ncbi:MAG: hypothetical protein ACLVEP_01815 [Faecalibacillus sp.]|uniref:hypothetical protein n=1 Tax=Faecalibacillus sp. TaxID=2678891 RepID=UPI00399BC371
MSLKAKYNFLHLFYWFTGCCINGFIAVFLQSKGLSNTEIGIVTGGSCVATIFLSPFMSSLISKIKGMTIKKLMTILMLTTVSLYDGFFTNTSLFSYDFLCRYVCFKYVYSTYAYDDCNELYQ